MSLFDSLKQRLEKDDEFLTVSLGDDPPKYCFPGQTISGWVVHRERLENGEATVTIQLAGSSQVKISDTHINASGHQSTNSSSEEHEFSGLGDQICIFKGTVQDVSGAADQQWTKFPFTITIPTEPFAPYQEDSKDEKQGEAAVNPENKPDALPASFETQYTDMGRIADVKVEYRLNAKLSVEPGQSWTTYLPLKLRTAGPKPTDEAWIRRLPIQVIKSPRLVPGQENASAGLRSKAKKLFGSSKIPTFAFGLIITQPKEIPLDDFSNSFAFQVQAKLDWHKTSQSLADKAPNRSIKGFKLDLVTKAHMSANSPSPRSFSAVERTPLVDFTRGNESWKPQLSPSQSDGIVAELPSRNEDGVVLPATATIGPMFVHPDDVPYALDLGRKFKCGLHTTTPSGSRLTAKLVLPNVNIGRFLRWEIIVEVAGEELMWDGEQAVTLLNPPTESVYY
jgi:hypothetical protein